MARLLSRKNWLLALLVFVRGGARSGVRRSYTLARHFPDLCRGDHPFGSPHWARSAELIIGIVALRAGLFVGIIVFAQDGESHWMEGVQRLAVYIILGMAFYWLPTPTS